MRRLYFGGSFNPIHHGHLICARAAAEAAKFDRVVMIPCAQPPHETGKTDLAPAHHRLEMCRLAAAAQSDLFEVNDLEIRRGGRSYTIDTARALKSAGWAEVSWLIGADMLMYLPKWHEPEALLAEVDFVVMARPGHVIEWASLPAAYRVLEKNVVETPLIDISSTEIRQRAATGRAIAYLTPQNVAEYIGREGLYQQ
jgi:nicotinate-nucleotide adenylyltransferase